MKRRLFLVLASLSFCGLAFFLLERWAGSHPQGAALRPVGQKTVPFLLDASGKFFRAVMVNGEAWLVQDARAPGYNPEQQVIRLKKGPGRKRIFLIGESSGMMMGMHFADLMKQHPDGYGAEFLNCAASGSSLEQMDRVFDEISEYSPDAVVVFFGNNLMTLRPILRPLPIGLARFFERTLFFRRVNVLGSAPNAVARDRLRLWERFLLKAARRSRRAGFRLVVFTVQGNSWWPPKERVREDARFYAAEYDYYGGRLPEAIDALRQLVEESPSAPRAFFLADCLFQQQRYDEARRYFDLASDLDDNHPRAKTEFNSLTRRLAAEEGFDLFDEAAWVRDRSPHGIPGWGLFDDDCHLTRRKLENVAYALLGRLQESGVLSSSERASPVFSSPDGNEFGHYIQVLVRFSVPFSSPTMRSVLYKMLLEAQRSNFDSAVQSVDRVVSSPGDASSRAGIASQAAEACYRLDRGRDALRLNSKAIRLAPALAYPHVQRALFLLKSGSREDVCSNLRQALRQEPGQSRAAYFAERAGCQ